MLAALAFPFAPVTRPDVTYSWPAPGSSSPAPAAIPMLPYQPVTTTASVSCDAARAVAPGTVLLSTTPPRPDPLAEPLQGLTMTAGPAGAVAVSVGGRDVAPVSLPGGPCSLTLVSGIGATTVALDSPSGSREVARLDGDVRPAVAGAFTEAPSSAGVAFSAVADTRFQTSAGGLKIALGIVAVAAFAVALGAVVVSGRRRRRDREDDDSSGGASLTSDVSVAPFSHPRPPRLVDAGVVLGLLLWQVIGPLTVDDGYIAGIVRSRAQNGQVGTVFRWLNSPETPFGWFYDVLALIARIDPAPFWLRLPATILAIVGWFLLSRAVLPRLGLERLPRLVPWLAGIVYLAWWLPYDLGVRPEPWVLVGSTAVFVLTERAVERRSVTPVVVALLIAGITLAVTPTGLMAFMPLLAAVVPLIRLIRAEPLGVVTFAVVGIAALGLTLVLVYADQTWASVLDSVGIRTLIGGDRPWTDEYVRYTSLLTVGNAEGNLGRRAPVLLLALALGALAFVRGRAALAGRAPRRRRHPALARHAGVHADQVDPPLRGVRGARDRDDAAGPRRLAACPRRRRAGPAAGGVGGGAGRRRLRAHARGLQPVALDLELRDHVVDDLAAARRGALRRRRARARRGPGGGLCGARAPSHAAAMNGRILTSSVRNGTSLTSPGCSGSPPPSRSPSSCSSSPSRCSPSPAPRSSAATPTRSPPTRWPPCTGAPAGSPTGSASRPTPPRASSPPPAPGPPSEPTAAMSGVPLPGWHGPGVTTAWFGLPLTRAARPDTPIVVTLTGPVAHGDVVAELGTRAPDGTVTDVTRVPLDEDATQFSVSASVDAPRARDLRLDPALATTHNAIRLVSAVDTPVTQGFTVPRLPVTVPWNEVLPPASPAAVDWPGAFLFPCTPFSLLRDGIAALPGWRVSTDARSEAQSGFISYTASQGGPWTTARALVREVRYPVYLPGLPLTDIASLERWVPTSPLVAPTVTRHDVGQSGLTTPGPLSIGES